MYLTLAIISFIILGLYVASVIIKGKCIPESISDTFYILEHKIWFGFSMMVPALLLIIVALEIYESPIIFLGGSGMMLVGAAPNFKDDQERLVHVTGASMALIFSQVWVGMINPIVLLTWIAYLIYTTISVEINWSGNFVNSFLKTKPLFWVEIISILNIYIILFSRLIMR